MPTNPPPQKLSTRRSNRRRLSAESHTPESLAYTRPNLAVQAKRTPPNVPTQPPEWMAQRRRRGCGCTSLFWPALLLGLVAAAYLLFPLRTNLLIMGLDYTEPWHAIGRTDTLILATIQPQRGRVALLSIPRDLWVTLPDGSQNRINTPHFFAEAAQTGSGPEATLATLNANFDQSLRYYIRLRFDGFREIVAALGGVDIELNEPMAGYSPGVYHLTGRKALAFARSRENSDDFFRMTQGQILIKAILHQAAQPTSWPRLPAALIASLRAVDTNIPVWLWPRLLFTALRAGPQGIESRQISRDMVTPTITDQGAAILLPNWPAIQALLVNHYGG